MIFDIILGILIIFLYIFFFITMRDHSDRIDNVHYDYTELRTKYWDIVHDTRVLQHDTDEMREALHMQGLATAIKTEEVKVLVKENENEEN